MNQNKTSMKVCIVSPCPPPLGGMAIQAGKLYSCLRNKNINTTIVRTNAVFPDKMSWVSGLPFLRTLFNTLLFLSSLHKQLKHTNIVYFLTGFFDFFFWITLPGILLIKLHGKTIVLNARGGGASLFFSRWKYIVGPVIGLVDKVTTPSGFLRAVFKQFYNIEAEIVPNIADLNQFKFKKREIFRPSFIVTRSLEKIYNIECVIRAFKHIHEKVPESRLDILGDGSLRQKLEGKVKAMGLNDAVNFHGELSHNNIQWYYENSDIFLNASNVDNLPGTILESFACGLPVVSTNAGGIPYMVDNNRTGLLVEKNDHVALAEKAIFLLRNQTVASKIVINAREECKKYSQEAVFKTLRSILSNLTGPSRKNK